MDVAKSSSQRIYNTKYVGKEKAKFTHKLKKTEINKPTERKGTENQKKKSI